MESKTLPVWLSGLALVSSAIFDAVGLAYFLFPVGLSLTAIAILTLNARGLHLDLGAKWAWIPLLLLWLSAFAHLCWHGDYQGLCFVTWIVSLYFLGRAVGKEALKAIVWGAAVASVIIIVSKLAVFISHGYPVGDYSAYMWHSNTFWKPHHLATLLIVAGMILSKDRRIWVLGTIAIALSGSEEGITALGLVLVILFLKLWLSGRRNRIVGLLALCTALGFILVYSGYAGAAYPNLTLTRLLGQATPSFTATLLDSAPLSAMDSILHGRVDDIVVLLKGGDWILGNGFSWTVMWTTPHMVVLKIASQFGIVAGLAWLAMMVGGLVKTQYKALILVMLWLSLIDHSLWTELAVWSTLVIGIATSEKGKEVAHAEPR